MWLWRHVAVVCVLLWMSHIASAIKGQTVRSSPDIPVTRFTCSGKPPGYYADLDTGCQVYHMCTEGGHQFSYQCPNTTLFQQRMLICAHWYQVNCSRSEQHYGANLLIGQRDKPFVNDDSREKIIKNLLNPELLQHLGEGINRQPKEHVHSDTVNLNRALPNSLNKDGEPSMGISGNNKTTFNKIPISNINTTQYPALVAGSVLPGGTKTFQIPKVPDHSFYLRNQFKHIPQYPSATEMPLSSIHESQQKNETYVVQNSTTESLAKTNLIYKTVVPVNSIKKQTIESTSKKQDGSSNLNHGFNFDPKPENDQSNDLLVASQVNAVSSSKSSSEAPNFLSWNRLTETSEKGIVQQQLKGNFPIDEYNTFINRFDPYGESEPEITTVPSISEDPKAELYTFINRYNPDDGQISVSNQSKEQPVEHMFINRFTLTPEEVNINQDKLKVDQLDNLLPPNSNIFVNPPSVEITPPKGSLDDSEDHVIELHFQDPRQNFFIPTDDKDTSKDAAPIVVTIPLKTDNKTSHMWFRTNDYKDKCTRCHPWFVTNKAECTPCVIIR